MQFSLEEEDVERIAERVFLKLKEFSQNKNENEYLTIEELGRYLKVKKAFIYQKVHAREMPFYKVGAKLRFDKKEINQWLKTQKSKYNKKA